MYFHQSILDFFLFPAKSFNSKTTTWGQYITSINLMTASTDNRQYWQILGTDGNPLQYGNFNSLFQMLQHMTHVMAIVIILLSRDFLNLSAKFYLLIWFIETEIFHASMLKYWIYYKQWQHTTWPIIDVFFLKYLQQKPCRLFFFSFVNEV